MAEIVDHPRASDRVKAALHAGYHACCDGLAAVTWFTFKPDARRGAYYNLTIRAGEREVQIGISPTGRSVSVYVDGKPTRIDASDHG